MAQILQDKNSATRFQIMVEIATSGPNIHQRSIALKLGVSPQAISDYIQQLVGEELIETVGRFSYKVSVKGVDWMLKRLREVNDYVAEAARSVINITVFAAIAECNLSQGQAVGLKMKNGFLFATDTLEHSARGIAVTSAKEGEDVGIANMEGLIEVNRGRITIVEVPTIQEGGSRRADLKQLKARLTENQQVGVIGIEALAALRRAGIEPHYLFGVAETAIEGAYCGLSFLIVCTADAILGVIKKLQEKNLKYEIISLGLTNEQRSFSPSLNSS